jgi:hypothetical protein
MVDADLCEYISVIDLPIIPGSYLLPSNANVLPEPVCP